MPYKYLNTVLIFLFVINVCYSQPNYAKGYSEFHFKEGCKAIFFELNGKDSIFYDSKNRYRLIFKYCNYDKKCYSKNNNKFLSYEGKVLRYEYHYVPHLVIEIQRIKDGAVMKIFFENIGEFNFSTKIKFKEGSYLVDVPTTFKRNNVSTRSRYSKPYIKIKTEAKTNRKDLDNSH